MTIGTSAPPTGSTNSTPLASEATTTPTASHVDALSAPPLTKVATDRTSAPPREPPNSTGCPGSTTGLVVMSSCSLRKVTPEPENDTDPTTIVNSEATSGKPPPLLFSSRNATI